MAYMWEQIASMLGGGAGSTGGAGGAGGAAAKSKGAKTGSGMTQNELVGGLTGLIIGTAIGKTNAERNRMAAQQSAIENLYSPFTGKRGKDVPVYADYVDPLKGLITGIAQGQKMGGPISGTGAQAPQTGSADYTAAAAPAQSAGLLDPGVQQGSYVSTYDQYPPAPFDPGGQYVYGPPNLYR